MFRLIAFLFLVFAINLVPVIHGSAASFDCGEASTATEEAICADPELSALDDMLGIIWQQYIPNLSKLFPIKDGTETPDPIVTPTQANIDQITWIKQTQNCGEDHGCISSQYNKRIRQLSNSVYDSSGNRTANSYRRYFKQTADGCLPSPLSVDAFYDEDSGLCYERVPNSRYVSLMVAGGVALLSYYELSPGYYDCAAIDLLQLLTDKNSDGSGGYWVREYQYSDWGDKSEGMRREVNDGSQVELNISLKDGIEFSYNYNGCGMRSLGLSGGTGFGGVTLK